MLKTGDSVKCIDDGLEYTTYTKWIMQNAKAWRENYFFSQYSEMFERDSASPIDVSGHVIVVAPHTDFPHIILVLVQAVDGDVFLIQDIGLAAQ